MPRPCEQECWSLLLKASMIQDQEIQYRQVLDKVGTECLDLVSCVLSEAVTSVLVHKTEFVNTGSHLAMYGVLKFSMLQGLLDHR